MVNQSAQGYTEYKFDVVGTAGTSHLEFDFRQDPSYWSIDSISLTPAGTSVPPPTATGLTLTGNELDNTLFGSSGNDVLNGGAGNDVMAGGAGDDTYFVDNLGDAVYENPNEGTDIIRVSVSGYTLSANVEIGR